MIDTADIDSVQGASAVDRDGDRLGKVGQVYVSEDGRQPLFVTVHTGLFGTNESFVPLEGANLQDGVLHLQYDKDTIKNAPHIADDGALTDDEQGAIFDYYDGRAGGSASGTGGTPAGLSDTRSTSDSTSQGYSTDDAAGTYTTGSQTSTTGSQSDTTATGRRTEGHDTSGPNTDDAMTLSEEQVHVGTEKVETGRARLRKHIVTEQRTVTVPVTHDEVRIEREPITDANRDASYSGPDLSEEEHEVVLTEERPVVQKETVAVERVRLTTDQVTENQDVTTDVRHEEVETDGADTTGSTGTTTTGTTSTTGTTGTGQDSRS